jgi:molybdopterin-containing oxidoreductase family membrane subunit
VDICTFAGTIGMFLTFFLLFLRFLPAIAMSEIKGVLYQQNQQQKGAHE